MQRNKKAILGVVSMMLVVGAVIGVVVGVKRTQSGNSPGNDGAGNSDVDALSSASKAVAAICVHTDHKQHCVDSMKSVSQNESATPVDYMKAAVNYTIAHVLYAARNAALLQNQTAKGGKDDGNMTRALAFKYCGELLDLSADELRSTLAQLEKVKQTVDVMELEQEIRNWLSAVMTYHGTCVDGFAGDDGGNDLHEGISKGLENSTQLTSNALAIFASVSDILNDFNLTASFQDLLGGRRRMLEKKDVAHDDDNVDDDEDNEAHRGFPRWMSRKDRKLLAAGAGNLPKPDVVVAKDGSGQFTTITAALASYPKNLNGRRFVIYVKAGIYNEYIIIPKDQINIFMYGDGPRKTIVTGRKSFKDGVPTYGTASFSVIGNGFMCRSMGFQNTAGAIGHQAVALRVQSDRSSFYNCRMDGYQDTLYQQAHYQFYRNCVISGTVDFIFGDSSSLIQNCLIIVRMPMQGQKNTVTAQGKADKNEVTGLIIQNCKVVPEAKLAPVTANFPSFLGRPWKQYSTTIVMESIIGGFISPLGWLPWDGSQYLNTLFYGEYGNKGPGAGTGGRVNWKGYHVLTQKAQVLQYTAGPFLSASQWLPAAGIPFISGLRYP
ncbi:Probable pectinesterase/pectinesterase inhibitor 21 [Linum grandiflorum]